MIVCYINVYLSLLVHLLLLLLIFIVVCFALGDLGTCQSVGCTVEGSHPHDLIDKINAAEMEVPDVSMAWWLS